LSNDSKDALWLDELIAGRVLDVADLAQRGFQDLAVMIDRPLEIAELAVDLHERVRERGGVRAASQGRDVGLAPRQDYGDSQARVENVVVICDEDTKRAAHDGPSVAAAADNARRPPPAFPQLRPAANCR
jgi:hypothetical protein